MSKTLGLPPGTRVLVTAGASGIGYAIATSFAEAGAKLHICDIAKTALDACAAAHPDWGTSLCDVSEEAEVERLFQEAEAHLGGLDVLVNNAGIAGPTGSIDTMDGLEWRRTIDVNLNSQFYCTKLAVPLLKQSENPSIICLSSVAGRLGYAFRTPYAASKWAIIGLVKSLAIELGPQGIRVNAILPGVVEGPRIDNVIAARAEVAGVPHQQMEQEYISKISLRRMVSAQDVANQALYLASPLGASISGQPVSVCGNVEVL